MTHSWTVEVRRPVFPGLVRLLEVSWLARRSEGSIGWALWIKVRVQGGAGLGPLIKVLKFKVKVFWGRPVNVSTEATGWEQSSKAMEVRGGVLVLLNLNPMPPHAQLRHVPTSDI